MNNDTVFSVLEPINDYMLETYGKGLDFEQIKVVMIIGEDFAGMLDDWEARLGVPSELIEDLKHVVKS